MTQTVNFISVIVL